MTTAVKTGGNGKRDPAGRPVQMPERKRPGSIVRFLMRFVGNDWMYYRLRHLYGRGEK